MRYFKSLERKIRSLEYRLRLAEKIPELEREIVETCKKYDIKEIGKYKIEIKDGKLKALKKKGKSFYNKVDSYYDFGENCYKGYTVNLIIERKGIIEYNPVILNTPSKVYKFFKGLQYEAKERFFNIALDSRMRVVGVDEVGRGSPNATNVQISEVFRFLFLCNSLSFILVHNHPSGEVNPSREDVMLTEGIKNIADRMGMELVDHVIIGYKKYLSFKDKGLI